MTTLNLIHLRATPCPFYLAEAIQQIMAYGHTVDEKAASSPPKDAICSVVTELDSNDVQHEQLRDRLRTKFLQLGLFDITPQEEGEGSRVVFSKYDLAKLAEASSSHFARLIWRANFLPSLPAGACQRL